jgi:hypothetical protein
MPVSRQCDSIPSWQNESKNSGKISPGLVEAEIWTDGWARLFKP